MGVGVSIGSSASFHVYVNKGLYRQRVFFLANVIIYFFFKSECVTVHVTQMGLKKKKYVMPFCTLLNPL